MMEIGHYATLFREATWKILLVFFSDKGAIESNSYYIKFITRKKQSIKCPTAMRTPEKPCKIMFRVTAYCLCSGTIDIWQTTHIFRYTYWLE